MGCICNKAEKKPTTVVSDPNVIKQQQQQSQQLNSRNSKEGVYEIQNKEDLIERLQKTPKNKLVVIDFYADWCGPCRQTGPKFLELAKEHEADVVFYKINVDDNEDLADENAINVMPTFHLMMNNEKIDEVLGANMNRLIEAIGKYKSGPH